ncbi:MAG TPA: DUF3365 domain-containing protein [Candidatus Paceibacterota bacterium]|nr:DUF3365 domain-containing protein [Verrucomicrobiota bacterium]HRY48029.1 DUF3365 domain-containing protein [Candidatus Paceibacterota bacterium]HSA01102.1 DUF3365 domain-containing protein [Candidatus Paceibacterota bacterium]
MKRHFITTTSLGLVFSWLIFFSGGAAEKTHKITTVSPRKMADALHSVIAADRAVYSRVIVERITAGRGELQVSEHWQAEGCLPVHAQMLRLAAVDIQKKGAEFSYALRSLWPINSSHGPQTAVEQAGLEFVAQHPGTNYYTEELLGGRSYFTAVYPDVAGLPSCVACHNRHPSSPRRNFKTNDIMGAIIVRVPLEF